MSDQKYTNEAASRGSAGDKNVENLIGMSYRPEIPDAMFAQRVSDNLVAAARQRVREREKTTQASSSRIKFGLPLIFFGILLPAVTIIFEALEGWCAAHLFDPIPTVWHLLLVAFVPLANLLIVLAAGRGETRYVRHLSWANGIAIGVALFYSMLFLPITPFAMFAVIIYGAGLLPLAPLCSLISAILLRRRLHRVKIIGAYAGDPSPMSGLWFGFAIGVLALIAIELPTTVTSYFLRNAVATDTKKQAEAVRTLRSIGSREVLLRACYEQPGQMTNPISFVFQLGNPVAPEVAREVYYRVTGTPFNAVPPPKFGFGRRNGARWNMEDIAFDPDVGGEIVAGRIKGLTLASSSLMGMIEPDAAVSYSEWTMVFDNLSGVQREARAQVALPPGGVISRLTLWVNGEEREAAFAGRGKVREAYQQVAVVQQRDPVLVTTCGVDRILVQCFPVPPGSQMKIRFGITAPLLLEDEKQAVLCLPHIVERNFGVASQSAHDIRLSSKQPLSASGTTWTFVPASGAEGTSQDVGESYTLAANLSDAQLFGPTAVIRARRSAESTEVLAPDKININGMSTRQRIVTKKSWAPSRVIFVIDGSCFMRSYIDSISSALTKLPAGTQYSILCAGDEVVELDSLQTASGAALAQSTQRLRTQMTYEGGVDNVPALAKAWNIANTIPNSVIVWIHGPQPIIFKGGADFRELWEKLPNRLHMYDFQISSGPNRIAERLDGLKTIQSVPHLSTPGEDLKHLFEQWSGEATGLQFVREQVRPEDIMQVASASDHVTRLWARDEVTRLTEADQSSSSIDAAVKLASMYQLVTTVTGAVVLENQQQYSQAGLEPVDANSVPSVPEPEEWLLLFVSLGVLMWVVYRRRRAIRAA